MWGGDFSVFCSYRVFYSGVGWRPLRQIVYCWHKTQQLHTQLTCPRQRFTVLQPENTNTAHLFMSCSWIIRPSLYPSPARPCNASLLCIKLHMAQLKVLAKPLICLHRLGCHFTLRHSLYHCTRMKGISAWRFVSRCHCWCECTRQLVRGRSA